MLDTLRRLYEENIANFGALPPNRKLLVVGVAVGVLFMAMVGWILAREPYAPLFPGSLDMDTTSETVAVLSQNNIPYQLGGINNNQVMVRASHKPRALQVTTESGVLAGADRAMDFLDQSTFGITDPILQLQNKRAMQRQLQQVLNQFRFVRASNVILTPEQKDLLERDYRPAQAAIQLDVRGQPPPGAIDGIVDLVRLSLPGLRDENIVITNLQGQRINPPRRDNDLSRAAEFYDIVHAEQEHRRQEITRVLEEVVGTGNAIVAVAVDKDFDRVEETRRELDVDNPAVISEQRVAEETLGTSMGGEPGVGSNVPNTGIGQAEGYTDRSERSERIVNHDYSTVNTHTVRQVGRTMGITVSVMLNYKRPPGDLDNFVPRDEDELAKLRQAVLHTLPPLGDDSIQVSLDQMLFDRTSAEVAQRAAVAAAWVDQLYTWWLPFAGLALIILTLVLLMLFNTRRTMRLQQQRAQSEMERAISETRLHKSELSLVELGIGEVSDISQLPPEEQRRIKLAQKVEEFCSEKPEEVANIVKTWLSES